MNAAGDAFMAWGPTPSVSIVLTWVNLGPVAFKPAQRGAYLSVTLQR
jgi:hypothetical protein